MSKIEQSFISGNLSSLFPVVLSPRTLDFSRFFLKVFHAHQLSLIRQWYPLPLFPFFSQGFPHTSEVTHCSVIPFTSFPLFFSRVSTHIRCRSLVSDTLYLFPPFFPIVSTYIRCCSLVSNTLYLFPPPFFSQGFPRTSDVAHWWVILFYLFPPFFLKVFHTYRMSLIGQWYSLPLFPFFFSQGFPRTSDVNLWIPRWKDFDFLC